MKNRLEEVLKKCAPSHQVVLFNLILNAQALNAKKVRILDVGGGTGRIWEELCQETSFDLLDEFEVVILDAHVDSKHFKNISFVTGVAPRDLSDFEKSSFDVVIGFDLIEHLSKDDGYLLLYEFERICSHSCMIFAPNGFVYQQPEEGNKFNAHISSWKPREMRNFGWLQILGHGGFRNLIGPYAEPKLQSNIPAIKLLIRIFYLFQRILVKHLPTIAFSFSAIFYKKDILKKPQLERIISVDTEKNSDQLKADTQVRFEFN